MTRLVYYIMWVFFIPFILLLNVLERKPMVPGKQSVSRGFSGISSRVLSGKNDEESLLKKK